MSAAVRAAVAQAVTAALADPNVTVLPFDGPVISGETVTVSAAGLSATEFRLFVRVYVPDIASEQAQDRLDELTETIDAAPMPWPRSDFELTYDEVKGAFFMQAVIEYPRSDF
jgi:hypothetical protein